MKKIREGFSLSAKKAGFILACTLIPFSMINGAAQSSEATSGMEVKDVTAELQSPSTIVLPPQAAGSTEPVEFHATDKEPAEKKNVYENTGKEASNLTKEEAASVKENTEKSAATTPSQDDKNQTSSQTTTIVEPPYTTTKITTETVTTKTVTTETRTTESSVTSGPGLPAEEKVEGPLAPVQEKHSWETPKETRQEKKNAPEKKSAEANKTPEKKQEPEANLKIKETEPKKKAPSKQSAKPAPAKPQSSKPAAKKAEPKKAEKTATTPKAKQNTSSSNQEKNNQAEKAGKPAGRTNTETPVPVPAQKEQDTKPAANATQTEEKARPIIPAEDESPSRSVTVKNSQYLDVIYPGTGWIYLGEKDANDLMRYYGRKVSSDGEETKFTLKATKSGKTVLHFYKNDALAGKFIEDYLEVSVSTETERDTHVTAPNYANYVPKGQRGKNLPATESKANTADAAVERPAEKTNQDATKIAASSSTGTAIERTSESAPSAQQARPAPQQQTANASSGDLLKKAQNEYDAKQYAECLSTIQEFYKNADESKMDQALYLEGRALEAPSPSRNIKSALHTYKTLVNRYPQSSLWEAANNRIIYIQRMYIDIR